jgi:Ion channel
MDQSSILLPIVVGTGATICTILAHALTVRAVVQFVRHERQLGHAGVGFWRDFAIVAVATCTALAAHLIEIALWAALFAACGEFHSLGLAFYHSAANYTTLGDGEVVMSRSWRLLGPLEAADGMLMFGVSTAMIFAVVQRLVASRFEDLRV